MGQPAQTNHPPPDADVAAGAWTPSRRARLLWVLWIAAAAFAVLRGAPPTPPVASLSKVGETTKPAWPPEGPTRSLTGRVVDGSGEPRADVHVVAYAEGTRAAATQTNIRGEFSFEELPLELISINATSEDGATAWKTALSGDPHAEIVLGRAAGLHGLVWNTDQRPASQATVVLGGSDLWPPRQTQTDEHGRFSFEGLPTGAYELEAMSENSISQSKLGLWLEAGASRNLELRLEPGRTLGGIVEDEATGAPLADAEVIAVENALAIQPRATSTDRTGRFELDRLRGTSHILRVRAPGYVSVERRLVPAGEVETISLRRGATITGTLVDRERRPIAGAEVVWVGDQDSLDPFVGAARSFQSAIFEAHRFGPRAMTGELGVTEGPVPNFSLSASAISIPPFSTGGLTENVTFGLYVGSGGFRTDSDGRFDLQAAPPGTLQLCARHPDHPTTWSAPFLTVSGETAQVDIVMDDGAPVLGRVVDSAGLPIAHTRVEMHVEAETRPEVAVTEEDGSFRFRSASGVTTFTAFPLGGSAVRKTLQVTGAQTARVELVTDDDQQRVEFRVVDPRGFGLAGARVAVRALRHDLISRRTGRTTEDGSVALSGLSAPPWSVQVEHHEFAPLRLEVTAPSPTEIRLQLEPASQVTGSVYDEWTGDPLAGASVSLQSDNMQRTVSTEEDGTYVFSGVGSGNYVLTFEADGMVESRLTFVHDPARGDHEVDSVELSLGAELVGRVVDAGGQPVTEASVTAASHSVSTDAQGRFHLRGLPAQESQVVANHPAAGETIVTASLYSGERVDTGAIALPRRFDPQTAALGAGRRVGLRLGLADTEEGSVVIQNVDRSSNAATSLQDGDVLLSVDDLALEGATHAEELLRGPVGGEVVIEILRQGERHRFLIARETQ